MTWQQFLIHAGSNRKGFTTSFGREKMSHHEKELIDPETEGSRWLAVHDKRRPPKTERDIGYYGPTVGFWYLGNSQGMVVQMMKQFPLKRKSAAGKPRGGAFRNKPLRVVPGAKVFSRKISDSHISKLVEGRKLNRAERRKGSDACRCSRCKARGPHAS